MSLTYHVIAFDGLLDISRYPEFAEAFRAVSHKVAVLIDLTEVEAVDSTFLAEVLLFKHRHKAPVSVLVPPSGNVPRIFGIANIGERMNVYTDRADALEALRVDGRAEPRTVDSWRSTKTAEASASAAETVPNRDEQG